MLDLIIIGGGPAGMTAALYAGRSKLKTKLVEKNAIGGQSLLTETIENFPGIYKMNSHDWVETVKKQLAELEDIEVEEGARVELVEKDGDIFKTNVISEIDGVKSTIESKAVIVATGALPKRLDIKGEKEFTGRGVSYCATCDAPFFKGKEVVVVGGGNAALEEALYLSRFVKHLTIIHRRDQLRATAILQEDVKLDPKISLKLGVVPQEIIGKAKVEGIKVQNVTSLEQEILPCDGVFVFVGALPDSGFLRGLVNFDETGYVTTDESMMSTCPGIFACGDCRKRPLNQVITACSDGAVAASSILKFLENKR